MTRTVRAALIIAALTLMTLLLSACTGGQAADTESRSGTAEGAHANAPANATAHANAPAPAHAHADAPPAAAPVSDYSIWDLETPWQTQLGDTIALARLAGRPRIIAMVYTSCAYACPAILKDLKRIEGELAAAGTDAGFVMISIDPERDTPERLREYAASTMLDDADWTLLTGTDDGVLELAALLGVRYRRVSDTDFEHSNVITLVDADGRIAHRQVGLGAEPEAIVRAVAGL